MKAIQFFQKILVVTLLCLAIYPITSFASFRVGDAGDEVREIQTRLQEVGYSLSNIDGVYGSETKNAVLAFQKDIGLEADGIVGRETYKALLKKDMPVSRSGSGRYRGLIATALNYRGVPYVFGGTSANGFDCSGFTQFIFASAGIYLPRTADAQFEVGRWVAQDNLDVGDLVFFSTYEPGPSHVGIYIGNGQFISAKSSEGIAVASIYDPDYWGARYIGARRI